MKYPAVCLFTMLLVACGDDATSPLVKSNAAAPDSVVVWILNDTSIAKSIELPAELLPFEQVDIFARVQGYIRELKVDMGDRVVKGQTLAIVEAPELQTKYAEFQSALQAAKARYSNSLDRYQRLSKAAAAKTPGIVAPVDLEQSRNQYLADSAGFEAARQLAQSYKQVAGYLVLQAPFNGVVTARNADRGALVGTNQSIFTIQDNNKLRLRVAVPEMYVSAGAPSPKISFSVDAYPSRLFEARLYRKSESIDPTTRTELWEYMVDNTNRQLKAGSFAYAKIAFERKEPSFLLPSTSIVTNQERKFVIRVQQGLAQWVDVRTGISMDGGMEVFGDLQQGDTLVLRASDERKAGTSAVWKLR
jgi:RND family efflux transporter MFP subunit